MARLKLIHRRPGSQNYYARMMVPKSARGLIGKREFIMSLGTSDRREAEALALSVVSKWKAEVLACTVKVANDLGEGNGELRKPSQAEIEEAALRVGFEEASRKLELLIKERAKLGPKAFADMQESFTSRYSELCRRQLAGDDGFWLDRAQKLINRSGWDMPVDSAEFAMLLGHLSRCGLDLFRKAEANLRHPSLEFIPSGHVQELARRRQERAADGEAILDLFDRYAAQRLAEGKKREDTLAQDRISIKFFSEFVGATRSIKTIAVDEVRDWRNVLATLPSTYRKRNAYQGLTFKEATAHAQLVGDKPITLTTVNKYLSALSALFSWAKREGYADRNPCDGLFYDIDKRNNPRPPFDAEQLNDILQSPLFTKCAGDGGEHKPGEVCIRDWRFWIPLICLFTGARIGEIAQLNVTDLEQEWPHWILHIRNDEKTGQKTKSGASRIAPVHSKLRALGFIEFFTAQRARAAKDGNPKLFPELSLNERGQNGRASRFWRTYLERIGLKSGADGFGSHSFRHGLADQLRLAGYYDHDIAIVLGHKQNTVTSGYGRLRHGTAARMNEIIEGARFEGVGFGDLEKYHL